MTSRNEQRVARLLRATLAGRPVGASIGDAGRFDDLLVGLWYFLPSVLAEVYPEWHYDSLDGIYPTLARKAGDLEAEVLGVCIRVTDQALMPLHVRLRVNPSADEIAWIEVRLGENSAGRLVTLPYNDNDHGRLMKRLYGLGGDFRQLDWFYRATYGLSG